MSSIFDLETDVNKLASLNDGMTRVSYQQVSATRDVTGDSFPNGTQHYKWTTSSTQWWIPARSYFRMRLTLKDAGGNSLNLGDDIAPNMGLCSNLFQSAELRLQGKTISRIGDGFLAQIDALETRMEKSKAYLDGTGASLNLWQPSIAERQSVMCDDTALNEKTIVSTTSGNDLGFDATTQVAIAADTGVITFSVVLPTVSDVFQAGDVLQIVTAGGVTLRYIVENADATTVTCSSAKSNILNVEVPTSITRIRTISPDTARGVNSIELIWKPPLSLMKHDKALPTGAWEIVLNPHNSSAYQKYGIESVLANKVAGTDFTLNVEEMFFYCAQVEGERFDTGSYVLDLDNTTCQVNQISGTGGFGQKDFTVSPSTYALTVAYQDSRVGTDSRISSTKFKSYQNNLPAGTAVVPQELKLNRFFINYNSQSFPEIDADPEFNTNIDRTAQRYAETQIMSGCMFNEGGCESIQEFHDRGSYYHFKTPQDAGSRATRVIVHQGFKNAPEVANMRVLLFSHHKSVMYVSVKDGQVLSVDVEEM